MHHLRSAAYLAEETRQLQNQYESDPGSIDNQRHRSYVTSSIVASGDFLEAQVNELIDDIAGERSRTDDLDEEDRSYVATVLNSNSIDFHMKGCLSKYQLLLTLLEEDKFDQGRNPYQDISHAWWFRNYLVHGKAKFYPAPTRDPSEDLENRGRYISDQTEGNPLAGSGNPDFPDNCMGYSSVIWCLEAVLDFSDEFFSRIGLNPRYNRTEIMSVIQDS